MPRSSRRLPEAAATYSTGIMEMLPLSLLLEPQHHSLVLWTAYPPSAPPQAPQHQQQQQRPQARLRTTASPPA
jgi:hypothetical protein